MFSDSELLWLVAPFAGAWIEIGQGLPRYKHLPSLPSRERGLKLNIRLAIVRRQLVAPFAGAWIEISYLYPFFAVMFVAPFAGAWIEI